MIALSTAALLAVLAPGTTDVRLLRSPDVFGDNVVFTYAGDLWVASTAGGSARRLTSSPGLESNAKFSPDGTQIAFTAAYDGASDVYVVPTEGGEPKRLTFDPEPDSVVDWTPDGKIAFVSTSGSFVNRQPRLWYVRPEGGLPIRTPIEEAFQVSFFADGKRIAYNRGGSNNFNWRRYRGGTQGKVSFYNFENNTYSELPSGREQNYCPMAVGESVFYISDKNQGTLNLYRYDLATKKETQLTKYNDSDIKLPSTDGKSIVFERDGYLFQYNIAKDTVAKLTPSLNAENLWSRPYLRPVANQISSMALSPSGARLLTEARGEIFSVPAKNGDTRNVTNTSGTRERFPAWSPDAKTIAYVSDLEGTYEVYTRPASGGIPTRLTSAKLPIDSLDFSPDSKTILITTESFKLFLLNVETKELKEVSPSASRQGGAEFSPDSKWLVFGEGDKKGFGVIKLYEIATGKTTSVSTGRYNDSSASFDLGGKYLYIVSSRTFSPTFGDYEFSLKVEDTSRVYVLPLSKDTPNPLVPPNDEEPEPRDGKPAGPPTPPAAPPAGDKPGMKIDLDNLDARLIPLPFPAANYRVTGVNNGVLVFTPAGITRFDLGSRESTPIWNGPLGSVSFNATKTKFAYNLGATLGVVDVRPGLTPGAGRVDTSGVEFVLNPRDEWNQMFWETWRFQKNNYYDADMRGLDWDAIGKKYAAYLPYVNHRSDLSYILGLMVGELGTGHAYVQGGDFGPGPRPVPVGLLGADYELSGDKVRFRKVFQGENFEESRRGPLGEPGINVKNGDYLLEIDGQKVDRNVHPNWLLLNKVGKYVTLTVNDKPGLEGSRKVRVQPISNEANLRYADFVEANRQKVAKLSGGRIGYMHVPNTAFEGAVEFVRGYYSQTDKDAMIIDERWNGGGYIQPWFVDTLARKQKAKIQVRWGLESADSETIEGPKAMLINGYAGSGGDFFPYMFRQAGLGPLIGKRTWGGLVGISNGAPLVDGGSVTSPSFAIYDPNTERIIAENTGIDPDIDVDARPDLWAKGQDPQLEKAIEVLLESLKKVPAKKVRTKVPQVDEKGKVKG